MDIAVVDLDVVREPNIFESMVENLGLRGKAIFYKCPKCNHEFTGGPAEEDDDYDVNDDDAEDNFLINNVFAAEALLLLNRM